PKLCFFRTEPFERYGECRHYHLLGNRGRISPSQHDRASVSRGHFGAARTHPWRPRYATVSYPNCAVDHRSESSGSSRGLRAAVESERAERTAGRLLHIRSLRRLERNAPAAIFATD